MIRFWGRIGSERGVAQPGSAPVLGTGGRGFESRRPDASGSGLALLATFEESVMRVRIYLPAKSAMQSGTGNTRQWRMEPILLSQRAPDALMGWASADDTLNQVSLTFPSRAAAIAYAKQNGLSYTVQLDHASKPRRRDYAENFRYDRLSSWTH